MTFLLRTAFAPSLALLPLIVPTPASAEEPVRPGLRWATSTTVQSDYRSRGLSYSDRKPSARASLSVEHGTGLHGSLEASSVRLEGRNDVEMFASAGWTTSAGLLGEVTLSAAYVGYARLAAADYVEASGEWRRPLGPLTAFAAVDYAPPQRNFRSNVYLHGGAEAEVPGTPFTLSAEIGRERGAFVAGGRTKWDWQVGASASLRGIDLGLAWVDANGSRLDAETRRLTRGGLVLSASAGF